MKLKLSKKDIKANRGITLIALVVTIIVLLILAGVAIATLTGDNGLLTKAGDARNTSIDAEIEEEIRLAWNKVYMDSYLDSNTNKATALQAELRGKDNTATVNASGSKLSVSYRGKDKVLDVSTGTVKEPSAVAKAISEGTVYNDNTPMTDEYENTFIIPKGFKLSKDSAEVVTEGIVIEDATYTNTLKSEFVWIPVSKDNKKIVGPAYSGTDRIEKKEATINLSRYTFDTNGVQDDKGANTIDNYYTELASSSYGNAVAKTDVTAANGFKEKTNAAGGFWIGRYEARVENWTGDVVTSNSNNETLWTGYTNGKLVEKPGVQVFNYITQNKASELSQKMYEKENDGTTAITKFESDLINSYAWDTATLFLQEFGWKNYSRQTSINTSGPNANGTVSDSNKDNPCNIYDMASNCTEWTTETYSDSTSPCVSRGGSCNYSSSYTSSRDDDSTTYAYGSFSCRPVLYIK